MSKDLIDRDALRQSIEADCAASNMPKMWYAGIAFAINHIIHAPTIDAVEVVRCKDCKHWSNDSIGYCKYHEIYPSRFDMDEWFCADGERKDGAE